MTGPIELYERMKQNWLGALTTLDEELWADDVVVETPYSGRRFEGRDAWLEYARAGRANLPPVRFEQVREIAVHETKDPEVLVIEYELTGVAVETGRRGTGRFIAVLRVRGGKIALWREYQDVDAMRETLRPA
jgi:ketosteroid isomerase-like protein